MLPLLLPRPLEVIDPVIELISVSGRVSVQENPTYIVKADLNALVAGIPQSGSHLNTIRNFSLQQQYRLKTVYAAKDGISHMPYIFT